MKSFLGLVLVAIFIVVSPAPALAQDTFVVDISYFGGDHSKMYNYDFIQDGKSFDADGVELTFKVKLGDTVTVGYRRESVGLYNSVNILRSDSFGEQSKMDIVFHDGSSKYRELYGSFELPRTHGHAIIFGIAKNTFVREWRGGTTNNKRSDTFEGLVVGGEGRQKIGRLTLDYSGRWYPPGMGEKAKGSNISDEKYSSWGHELRGTATWAVSKHFGLTGGYEYRRFQTDRQDVFLPMTEVQTVKAIVIGTRLSF